MQQAQLKSFIGDAVKAILKALDLNNLMALVRKHIPQLYQKGLEDAEVNLDMNFEVNSNNLKFLEDYTFENIKGMTADIAEKLRKELTQGLMANESISQLSARVKGVMDVATDRAVTIARTEGARAENMGKLDGMLQAGITAKKYLMVALDDRTSPICRAMFKKYGSPEQAIAVDKLFKVVVDGKEIRGLTPPFHPNCRTVIAFQQV